MCEYMYLCRCMYITFLVLHALLATHILTIDERGRQKKTFVTDLLKVAREDGKLTKASFL